jgi:hypothetical protein
MNLRVFQSAEKSLVVEISSPELKSKFKWFVPLLPEGSEKLQNIVPTELAKVVYESKHFHVPFLLILTVQIEEGREMVVGSLNLEDSINVLNNIYDRLAFDPLPATNAPKKAAK